VGGRIRATKRARIVALTGGGAIPDVADYRVIQEPGETFLGTLNEDFAIESSAGDIFQLGNASWRILRVERGTVRVADAQGAPPSIPFWLGEGRGRTEELSAVISEVREETDAAKLAGSAGVSADVTRPLIEYFEEGRRSLGAVPSRKRVILERFFDETGGMQLVVHAPFGSRINRAWGLALRKRFCRHFGFELQAAANEEAIVLSLGPQHSFPLEEVYAYLHPKTARDVLIQALLATPMFQTRWRWNLQRALLLPRFEGGRRLPAPIARMRAEDLLVKAFPEILACPENLPAGALPVPLDHPLVVQTIDDCLHEVMDVDGFLELLEGLRNESIEKLAVDVPEPSAFARGILNANPYSFLDDAPLEERRTQAVFTRRTLDARTADEIGQLDPAAVARVKQEAWPDPRDAEELHEALGWMGWITDEEAAPWRDQVDELRTAGRVTREDGRWFAVDATRDPLERLRGRMEAVGPIFSDDPLLPRLEASGHVLRVRLDGREAWCGRRLLARIQRYTLETLRKEIEPVSAAVFLRFLACWQRVDPEFRAGGPAGLQEVLDQLGGYEAPAAAWERSILARRVRGYRPEWLDELTMTGELVWGRLWGEGSGPVRTTPIAFVRVDEMEAWRALAGPAADDGLSGYARAIQGVLAARGAVFHKELARAAGLLPEHFEAGLGELISRGAVTCDTFRGLRQLLLPASRRRQHVVGVGRWSLFRGAEAGGAAEDGRGAGVVRRVAGVQGIGATDPEFIARKLLARWGVVFRRVLLRERQPIPWRDLIRVYRLLELRGDIRGGRFVGGFAGEQYALPGAVELLRRVRRDGEREPVSVSAADPLNLAGILTPEERVPVSHQAEVALG
jgi:ATP-dependent Lhr-like helicase